MKRIIRAAKYNDEFDYPLASELKRICEQAGYELYGCDRSPSSKRLYLSIMPPQGRFPEIIYDKNGFRIQTTSYGALNAEEFRQFVQNQDIALSLVEDMQNAIHRIGVSPETVKEYTDY